MKQRSEGERYRERVVSVSDSSMCVYDEEAEDRVRTWLQRRERCLAFVT